MMSYNKSLITANCVDVCQIRTEILLELKHDTSLIFVFTETCRCRRRLTTNWRNFPPYVNVTSLNDIGVIIPKLLVQVVDQCCGWCREHNRSVYIQAPDSDLIVRKYITIAIVIVIAVNIVSSPSSPI